MKKIWKLSAPIDSGTLQKMDSFSPLLAQVLFTRGIYDVKTASAFLDPEYDRDLSDPFLFADMEKAVERILQAVANKEKVVVHGDYDADGVCSSTLLVSTLREIGADVSVYLPHREREGYGLNTETIRQLAAEGTRLIITTDCGTSNVEEVALANQLGLHVIITDHHLPPPQLPDAFALINPQIQKGHPSPFLCGTGVAFKLACALAKKSGKISDGFIKWLLDLVAIATIADCMLLIGENRALVKYGLVVLRKTRRKGLRELMRIASLDPTKIDASTIGWRIAPLLNAIGRLGHSKLAFDLLMSQSNEEASAHALHLFEVNQKRQKMTEVMVSEAKTQIGMIAGKKVLFAYDPSWSVGIVGLVAGRLANEYHRPAFVMGAREDIIVGSGRSIPGVDITGMLRRTEKFLARFGGHEQACGFTLRDGINMTEWQRDLSLFFEQELQGKETNPYFLIDTEVSVDQLDDSLLKQMESLQPFGEGNDEPIFLARSVNPRFLETVGKEGKHLRFRIQTSSGKLIKTIGFRLGFWTQHIHEGEPIDILFSLRRNVWNGSSEIQLNIQDLDRAGSRAIQLAAHG